jgi:hypothetical protein
LATSSLVMGSDFPEDADVPAATIGLAEALVARL